MLPPADDADIDADFFQSVPDAPSDPADDHADAPVAPPRLGLLAQLQPAEFDEVARAAKLSFVPADTIVFEQADRADRFFILVDGAVEVERDGAVLATLGPGSFFGESALLVRGRRSATVRTVADSSVWSISYQAFDSAVSHHFLADDARREEAERRIAETPSGGFDGS